MADERVIVSRNKLEAIVAALKEKTGEEDGYTLSEIPDAILNIGNNISNNENDGIFMKAILIENNYIPAHTEDLLT